MNRRMLTIILSALALITMVIVAVVSLIAQPSSHGTAPGASSTIRKETPTPTLPIMGVTVQGQQITTTDGHPIVLVGASHSSLEYQCDGDGHFQLADFQAMRSWGMNVVRIPLWSKLWLNTDGSCPKYQTTVKNAVAAAEAAHLYVILDLQWIYPLSQPSYVDSSGNQLYQYPMPDTGESVTFWKQIATLYRNDPRILFDLYGEPNAVTWQSWYAGGAIVTPNGTYQAIGMRALTDIVRAIAPKNVIIISGTNWGYDLSEVGTTYTFPERNLLFGTHPFDYGNKQPADFDRAFGTTAAASVAVIATEFGSYDCATNYISSAIAYFNLHHMSWLAWSWSNSGCGTPSLLSNWNGTPSQPYGAFIQTQIRALNAPGAP